MTIKRSSEKVYLLSRTNLSFLLGKIGRFSVKEILKRYNIDRKVFVKSLEQYGLTMKDVHLKHRVHRVFVQHYGASLFANLEDLASEYNVSLSRIFSIAWELAKEQQIPESLVSFAEKALTEKNKIHDDNEL